MQPADVKDAVMRSIEETLTRSFGASTAKAVNFYFDPAIAVTDPEGYTKMLRKTLMGGAEQIVNTITSQLCQEFGLVRVDGMTLADCLRELGTKGRTKAQPAPPG